MSASAAAAAAAAADQKKRAIAVYVDTADHFYDELLIMYTCWTRTCCHNTSLVVFCKPHVRAIPRLAIVFSTPGVVYVMYEGLNGAPHQYAYLNSIDCMVSDVGVAELTKYKYVLRTDTDIFLTSAFTNWWPVANQLVVGRGAYCHDAKTRANLKVLAQRLGLSHMERHNLGSTWYGETAHILNVARMTCVATRAALQMFADDPVDKAGVWPSWYRGVCLLYGSEVALNHFEVSSSSSSSSSSSGGNGGVSVVSDGSALDSESTSNDYACNHAHIHCWHTQDTFSKFVFGARKYTVAQALQCRQSPLANTAHEPVHQYCMRLAYDACPHQFS